MPIRSLKPSQKFLNHFKTVRKIDMPLVKGAKAKTKEGFSKNVSTEIKSGKPKRQAIAIAYSEAGEKKIPIKPKKKRFWKD